MDLSNAKGCLCGHCDVLSIFSHLSPNYSVFPLLELHSDERSHPMSDHVPSSGPAVIQLMLDVKDQLSALPLFGTILKVNSTLKLSIKWGEFFVAIASQFNFSLRPVLSPSLPNILIPKILHNQFPAYKSPFQSFFLRDPNLYHRIRYYYYC